MRSEAAARADFSAIRYAQVWEDADVLLAGARHPAGRRLRVDRVGRRQRAGAADEGSLARDRARSEPGADCLPRAAGRRLSRRSTHPELLELWARGHRRAARSCTSAAGRRSARPRASSGIGNGPRSTHGIGSAGKFERYFALFRNRVLPLVHSRPTVAASCWSRGPPKSGGASTRSSWDTWRWRLLFRLFFSRTVMGRLGRDPEFFRYVDIDVAASHPGAHQARADRAGSGRQPVRALDSHRHARRRAPLCAARRSISRRSAIASIDWSGTVSRSKTFLERSPERTLRSIATISATCSSTCPSSTTTPCSRRSSAAAVPARGSPTGTCWRRGGGPIT